MIDLLQLPPKNIQHGVNMRDDAYIQHQIHQIDKSRQLHPRRQAQILDHFHKLDASHVYGGGSSLAASHHTPTLSLSLLTAHQARSLVAGELHACGRKLNVGLRFYGNA